MNCSDLQGLLSGYAADELSPVQTEFVALHLRECPGCRRTLDDLRLTHTQLETLRFDGYHPQLTDRINRALYRRHAWLALGRWGRFGAAVSLPALVVLVLFLVLRTPGLTVPTPASGHAVYLVAGGWAIAADSSSGEARRLQPVAPGAQVAGGFLLTEGTLYQLGPDRVRPVAKTDGLLVGGTPDGSAVWVARQIAADSFAVDRVAVATGEISPGPEVSPGQVHGGIVSDDGQRLYLLAGVADEIFVKVISTGNRERADAYRLPLVGRGARLLAHGETLYVVDEGLVVRLTLAPDGGLLVQEVPGLTHTVALAPDGSTLAAVLEDGDVALIDSGTLRVTRRTSGAGYQELVWTEPDRLLAMKAEGFDRLTYPGLRRVR